MYLFIIFAFLVIYLETVISNIRYKLVAVGLSRLIRQIRYSNNTLVNKILSKTIKVIKYS